MCYQHAMVVIASMYTQEHPLLLVAQFHVLSDYIRITVLR